MFLSKFKKVDANQFKNWLQQNPLFIRTTEVDKNGVTYRFFDGPNKVVAKIEVSNHDLTPIKHFIAA